MLLPPEIQGPTTILGTPKRLDHLPAVGQILRELGVARVIDDLVPEHPTREVSTGTCVEAMVLSILQGSHTLYRVGETLKNWDLRLILGKDVDAEQLHDTRLGRALDCLFNAGLGEINAGILLEAVRAFDLDLRLLHHDTTSISVHGAYAYGPESDPENPDSAPVLTHGYSKDCRPDLKQAIFGLTVSNDGFVPLLGRVTDGNRSDNLESGFAIERIAEVMPHPEEITLVGDCKLFTSNNLRLVREHGLNFVTLLPRGLKAWERAYEAAKPLMKRAPVLRELVEVQEVDHDGEFEVVEEEVRETWSGASVETFHAWREDPDSGNEAEDEPRMDLRALVVRSTQLERLKSESLAKAAEKEAKALEKLAHGLQKREFACEHDAAAVVQEAQKKPWRFHSADFKLERTETPAKPGRGRPKKDAPPTPTKSAYRVTLSWTRDERRLQEEIERESVFILVTLLSNKLSRAPARADEELLAAYLDQNGIEAAFRWLKGPAAVAPIFLETEHRIAALALIYVIALMVNALIQRRLRARLQSEKVTIPGNKGRTNKPTSEVFFRLLENLQTLDVETAAGDEVSLVLGLTTEQDRALKLFGLDLLSTPGVIGVASPPSRGQRGGRGSDGGSRAPRFQLIRRAPPRKRRG